MFIQKKKWKKEEEKGHQLTIHLDDGVVNFDAFGGGDGGETAYGRGSTNGEATSIDGEELTLYLNI